MKNWQFNQYLKSYHSKSELIKKIEEEIEELYEDVSPALTGYHVDSITKMSVSVESYVFYIIERKAELNYKRKRVEQQYETVQNMLNSLSKTESDIFHRSQFLNFRERKHFKSMLEQFVTEDDRTPYSEDMNVYEYDLLSLPVEEYDNAVEAMDDAELFSDYYDSEGTIDIQINERNRRMNEMRNGRGRKIKAAS